MHLLNKMRMLMAEEGASGGNGAIPAPAPAPVAATPSDPPAQGVPSQVDVEAIRQDAAKKARDAAFAEMRRDGLLRNKPKKPDKDDPPEPAKTEPSVSDLVKRARHFERAVSKYELSDRAIERLEKMLETERPDDIGAWVSSALDDMGIKPRGAADVKPQDTSPKQPATAANAVPVTAAGGTPPPRADIEDAQIVGMSQSDVEALIARKGLKWYVETLFKQSRGKRVSLRSR